MAKNKLSIGSPVQLANKLFKVREELAAWQDSIKPLKEKEENLRTQLLESIKANRLPDDKFRDNEHGITYAAASRTTYKITDEAKALPWLEKNDCFRVDTVKMGKVLKQTPGALPEGFWVEENPYLSVTGMKDALE